MISLTISIILGAIGIILFIIGWASDDSELGAFGFCIMLFVGLLGFGLACNYETQSSTEIQIQKFSYAKTESELIIQTPEKTETFSDAHTFNSISDSSKIFIHTDYNVYGGKMGSHLIIK